MQFVVDFVHVKFEEGQFICSELSKGAMSEVGKCVFNAANV